MMKKLSPHSPSKRHSQSRGVSTISRRMHLSSTFLQSKFQQQRNVTKYYLDLHRYLQLGTDSTNFCVCFRGSYPQGVLDDINIWSRNCVYTHPSAVLPGTPSQGWDENNKTTPISVNCEGKSSLKLHTQTFLLLPVGVKNMNQMTDTRGKDWIPIKSIFPISYYHLIRSEKNFVKVRTYLINPVNSISVHAHTTTTFIYIILLVSSSNPSLWGGSSCRA